MLLLTGFLAECRPSAVGISYVKATLTGILMEKQLMNVVIDVD